MIISLQERQHTALSQVVGAYLVRWQGDEGGKSEIFYFYKESFQYSHKIKLPKGQSRVNTRPYLVLDERHSLAAIVSWKFRLGKYWHDCQKVVLCIET